MSIGLIILRHVNNFKTNQYWMHCYDCIRKYYPENKIIIIDDNSSDEFLTKNKNLYETTIINSEFPRRGELLPYYYYLHNKLFDTAVLIHDSIFINSYINFNVNKFKFLWKFENELSQQVEDEINIINSLNNNGFLLSFYNNRKWSGCFGAMCVIEHDYLKSIDQTYNISNLLNIVRNRYNRCSFERVLGCMLLSLHQDFRDYDRLDKLIFDKKKYVKVYKEITNNLGDSINVPSLKVIKKKIKEFNIEIQKIKISLNELTFFGDIQRWLIYHSIRWGLEYEYKNYCKHLPIIKVRTGR